VRLRANGTVVALQSVDIRAQITSTVREVHIREGQTVAKGDLLVSLDSRAEEANLRKAEAQVEKDRADLANAQRTLERQRQLFVQKFISQSALDAAESQVESLKGQLAVDLAAVEGSRVALANTLIRASFAGRTGAIGVRPGSLVQPNGTVLVTVTQVDPIQVSFTLPEQEFPGLQRALAAGPVAAEATPDGGRQVLAGRVNFLDNAVDTATGTIRVKAEFDNRASRLWPGMYVNVTVAPRTLEKASVVPVQAVQTGPESRFVFVVGEDRKVAQRTVAIEYLDAGIAAVTGVEPGAKIVVEGAQNLRPGSTVTVGEGKAPEGAGKGKAGGKAPS
jgi:RND family efflux transporter MFP subunit